MAWLHLVLFALFTGLGVEMIRAVLMRRKAVELWRAAAGGGFDRGQNRFVTELDLDRALLPPDARNLLQRSRRSLMFCLLAMTALLIVQLWLMMGA